MTNILYRTFFANKGEEDVTVAGLAHHMALTTINKYYKTFHPHKIIMCFDRPNWRKKYTNSDKCISKVVYKGNRRKNMTAAQRKKFEAFIAHITEFEKIMKDHTSAIVLTQDNLEADDLIAGVCDVVCLDPANEVIITSADKDLLQCMKHKNVTLINPADGKARSLVDWNNDPRLFMFEKCIRGDRGDNVQSAFPRCRKTRIIKAYNDPLECVNLMHEQWIRPTDNVTFTVGELFKENEILMDLSKQPEDVYRLTIKTVIDGMNATRKFSYFHFLQFLGKYKMKKIVDSIDLFIPMLSR